MSVKSKRVILKFYSNGEAKIAFCEEIGQTCQPYLNSEALMLTKLKALWPIVRKFAIQFYYTTPCKECLRGRLWFMFTLGAVLGGWISIFISIPALIMLFVHIGRKNNWWLDD